MSLHKDNQRRLDKKQSLIGKHMKNTPLNKNKVDNIKELFNSKSTIYGNFNSYSRKELRSDITTTNLMYPEFSPNSLDQRSINRINSLVDQFSNGNLSNTQLKSNLKNMEINSDSLEVSLY